METDYRQLLIELMNGGPRGLKKLSDCMEVFNDKEVMGAILKEHSVNFVEYSKAFGVLEFSIDDCMLLLDLPYGIRALRCGFDFIDAKVRFNQDFIRRLVEVEKKGEFENLNLMFAFGCFNCESLKRKEWVEIFLSGGFIHKGLFVYLGDDENYILEIIKNNHNALWYASSRLRGNIGFAKRVFDLFDCEGDEKDQDLFRKCFVSRAGMALKNGAVEYFGKKHLESVVEKAMPKAKQRIKI